MERVSRWRLALLIALLLTAVQLAAAPSVAQWSVVSPRAILRDNVENTAITYCDGVVWAGCKNLLRSADSGRTWQSVPLDFRESGDRINDIQFFDRNTGIVTTYFGAFLTTDGGRHWMDTLDNQINAVASVTLLSSPRRIAVADFGGEVYLSNDGGAYWSIQRVDSNASQIVYHKGDLYLLASSFVNWGDFFGVLYRSTDRGATWRSLPGQFSSDSYTVMFDSCQGTMYMTNEGFEPQDQSNIITSTDGGTSWQISISSDPEFFSGSLAEGKHVIYTATSTGGVFRYDQSAWKSIGGPNCGVDMRSLCAINDSLLIVVDANGSIWRTENSGGVEIPDVYRAPALSVAKLFASDTLAGCETRSASAVVLPSSGFICTPPTIASQHITGPDSEYYALEHVASANLTALDSEVVLFMPDADRDYSATLVVQLSDGTTMNLDLGGHGTDKAMIRLLAQSITTDTIGDMILPIKTDRDIPSAFDLRMKYDTSVLVFDGAYNVGEGRIDKEPSVPGMSTVHIQATAGLAMDSTIALLHFKFYPTAQNCANVTFDSARFFPDTSFCGIVQGTVSQICGNGNCGQPLLSGYMRTGSVPAFSVAPNPATNVIEIFTNNLAPNEDVTIDIMNNLGIAELHSATSIRTGSIKIDLSDLPTGPKIIRLSTAFGVTNLPLLLVR